MAIKLYIDYFSQPSRAVLALCLINKIPHTIYQIRVNQFQNLTPQFENINALKKVPAIVDQDLQFHLSQSHAIMRYFCRKYQINENWYPGFKNLQRTSKIDEYLDFHHCHTRKCFYWVYNTMFAEKMNNFDSYFKEQKSIQNVQYALQCVQKIFLKKGDYLIGNQPSIADLSAYFQIQFLYLKDFKFFKILKNVQMDEKNK